jgi:hypothetical protein
MVFGWFLIKPLKTKDVQNSRGLGLEPPIRTDRRILGVIDADYGMTKVPLVGLSASWSMPTQSTPDRTCRPRSAGRRNR